MILITFLGSGTLSEYLKITKSCIKNVSDNMIACLSRIIINDKSIPNLHTCRLLYHA